MNLCVCGNKSLIILKTTYDQSVKNTSPAMLMHEEIIKEIFQEREFVSIEFYGRVMDWHNKLTNNIRQMYHINYYRSGLIKYLHNFKISHQKEKI